MSLPSSTRPCLCAALLGACLGPFAATAAAAPERIALVLGNSEYYNLPAAPACTASAEQVGEALRGLGYQVVQRLDSTSGGIAAAMGQFQRALEGAPGASAIVYFCGYAAAMDKRLFVLPVSANLVRPSDVRTQGILAKAFLDLTRRGHTSRALVLMDLDSTDPLSQAALNGLAQTDTDPGTGMIAVVGSLETTASSPLAAALPERLAAPDVKTAGLLSGLESGLKRANGTKVGAMHLPVRSLALAEEDAPKPVAPPEPPRIEAQPPTSWPVAAQPPVVAQPVPQPVAAPPRPQPSLPDEAAMTAGQRRMVQIGLARFGYYGGRIDSVFGPETRAAIRQYQGEIGAEPTGVITGEQAAQLLELPY